MIVDLPPQIERIVQDADLSGQFRTAEDVVAEALSSWQERQKADPESAEKHRQQAIESLRTFGQQHGLSLGGMTIGELRNEARP